MRKRILSVFLVLMLLVGMLPASAWASNVTEIRDQAGLAALQTTAGSYQLAADLTLENWEPIDLAQGTTLDGNGHTIRLTGTPLLGEIGAEDVVKNLILTGSVEETENQDTGALARRCKGVIRNCASNVQVTYTATSPYIYLGGLAGKVTGTISNCLVTGRVENTGKTICYGAISNIALFEHATIENCVAVGCDRIASEEGWTDSTPISGTNCVLIASGADYVPEDYVDRFNANRTDGDLEWGVADGMLLPRASGSTAPDPDATEEELSRLDAAIDAAKGVDKSRVYTSDTWEAFCAALNEAKSVQALEERTQSAVLAATEQLREAQGALCVRGLSAVDLSDQDVISITSADALEELSPGKYYRLDADITIGDFWFGKFNTMDAVLDGNGHTVTLNGAPLWKELGPNAIVQNLGILGTAKNSMDHTGAIAKESQGLVVNCWSRADVSAEGNNGIAKDAGGFFAVLKSGGAVVNSYVAGGLNAKGTTGAIAAKTEENTLIQKGYWLNTVNDSAAGEALGMLRDCAGKVRAEFYSDSFLNLLNSSRGAYGRNWTIDDEGWPHLGVAGSFVPPQPIQLVYTPYEGYGTESTAFSDAKGLALSLNEVLPSPGAEIHYYVGKFTYPDYAGEVAWVPQYAPSGNQVFVNEDGELQVLGAGSVTVVVYDKASWSGTVYDKELTRFTVTVSDLEAEEIRLIPTGEYVSEAADGSYVVEGSAPVSIQVEIMVDGAWRSAPASLFTFTQEGSVFGSGNTFYATEPGDITVHVTGLGKTAQAKITSSYVPVTSIMPALQGSFEIHDRNANSESMGSFLDLMLSHGAGTVIVQPENASYRDSWTLNSSDPETAAYVHAFLRAVLPYKAGTVTLTAVSLDPNLTEPVTGTSTITLKYFNPLRKVELNRDETLSVKENETMELPLVFTGSAGKDGYHVTEPGMNWTFSGDGAVEISRSPLGMIVGKEGSAEYCVANDVYKITGVKAGLVTVTGTPVDQTGGAQPITFTISVTPGEAEQPADVDRLVAEGNATALQVLQDAYAGWQYQYGDEWMVFMLTRTGNPLTQEQVAHYFETVSAAFAHPGNAEGKPTTIARVILAISALGRDATNFEGINFVQMLCESDLIADGSNEAAWALIALDCRDYAIPASARWNRESLIAEILKFQNPASGGFGLADACSDSVDMTAMCVQALAPYVNCNPQVKAAVDAALRYLRSHMDRNCNFDSVESIAQVLIALTALGLDPLDPETGFVGSVARNLFTALDAYRTEGGYRHLLTDASANNMATIQAWQALTAYVRFCNGQTALYDLMETQEPDPVNPIEPPRTGDTANVALLCAVMSVSILMLLAVIRKRRFCTGKCTE